MYTGIKKIDVWFLIHYRSINDEKFVFFVNERLYVMMINKNKIIQKTEYRIVSSQLFIIARASEKKPGKQYSFGIAVLTFSSK